MTADTTDPVPEPLRSLRAVSNLARRPQADGFEVAFLRPESIAGGMDPFLQIDAFALAQPIFKPHPHAGFNAVTYLLPESPFGFINRDSLGNRVRIEPGGLHWTTAGSGILHEEVPEQLGVPVLGLQMFINLPHDKKSIAPGFLHLAAAEVPELAQGCRTVRVVLGEHAGVRSPLQTPTAEVGLLDVRLDPGASFEHLVPAEHNLFLWLLQGPVLVREHGGAGILRSYDLAGFQSDGSLLRLHAGEQGGRLLLFTGRPLNESIAAYGPFVMADEDGLRRAMRDFHSGRMGTLSASRYDAHGHPVT